MHCLRAWGSGWRDRTGVRAKVGRGTTKSTMTKLLVVTDHHKRRNGRDSLLQSLQNVSKIHIYNLLASVLVLLRYNGSLGSMPYFLHSSSPLSLCASILALCAGPLLFSFLPSCSR
jgi:hypothetical protein